MKRISILSAVLIAGLSVQPAWAEEEAEGFGLMDRGVELFFRGLREEMAPALRELEALVDEFGPALQEFAAEMGPALTAILEQVEDWSAYHPPEFLPNGDIIIRKKTPAERIAEGEEIEL